MNFTKNNFIIKYRIDHIVYTVFDLDAAIQFFTKKIGVTPIFGGYHKNQGTKNALINLSDECYLEILAIDNTNTSIKPPRWMGVDVLKKNQITRFALKSKALKKESKILKLYDSKMGIISNGLRQTSNGNILKWELTLPLPKPEVEIFPFLIDWSGSKTHPSLQLPQMDCKLIKFYGTHPNPKKFDRLFEMLDFSIQIKKDKKISLQMILDTPKGLVTL
nr:VOC family protein [Aquimarina agarivorans]